MVVTDFTENSYANGCPKAVLMPIIGHTSKLACGWAVGKTWPTEVALRAWRRARETLDGLGIPYSGMICIKNGTRCTRATDGHPDCS